LDETRSFIENSIANFEQHNYGLWLIFKPDDSRLIGFAGLLSSDANAPNLIYGIHPDFGGRGYATEAATAILSYGFNTHALTLIKADVDEPNVASVRVLEKLGMKRTGNAVVKGRPLLYFEKSNVVSAS
jgi:RimJ/RimL family protein N-acetyltransferase